MKVMVMNKGIQKALFTGVFSLVFAAFLGAGDAHAALSVTIDDGNLEVDLLATTREGVFRTSNSLNVSVSSSNYTGYVLSIRGNYADGKLNGSSGSFSSITDTEGITEEEFAASSEYNGFWGFLPSKVGGNENTKYLPSPTAELMEIEKTTSASEGVAEYSFSIGARANVETPIDEYSNSFVISVVANPAAYRVTYNANSSEEVTGMPASPQTGPFSVGNYITLPAAPTREGSDYKFRGWCAGTATLDGADCSGMKYNAGANYYASPVNTEALNELSFTALWSTCDPGKVCYNGNGADAGIATGQQTMAASTTTLTLFSPNYKRAGYGFLGWSTKKDPVIGTDRIYGPNETISGDRVGTELDTTNGLTLYAVWLAADTNDTMQTFNTEGHATCSDTYMTKATLTYDNSTSGTVNNAVYTVAANTFKALRDERDNNVYVIGRLSDGECWMLENLRVDQTVSAEDMASGSQGVGGKFTKLAESENTFSTATTANSLYSTGNAYTMPRYSWINTHDAVASATGTGVNTYGYGNYYTWAAAKANTTAMNDANTSNNTMTSICPTGWRLPIGNSGDVAKSFAHLSKSMGGTNAYMGSSTLPTDPDGIPTGTVISQRFRQFPNNFVYSGYRSGAGVVNRGARGYYWSSTAGNSNNAYNLYFNSSNVYPGTDSNYKYRGYSVRCVAE